MVAITRSRGLITGIPPLISIFVYQVIAVYFYLTLHHSLHIFVIWVIMQAFGNIGIGYLSDHHCRRRLLILTQFAGLVAMFLHITVAPHSYWPLALLGLFYNPPAVARAGLVDNLPRFSKVKLIAATFVLEMAPWALYMTFSKMDILRLAWLGFVILLINLLFTILFFEDRRDAALQDKHLPRFNQIVHHHQSKRLLLTLFAVLPIQIGFFLTDTIVEKYPDNARLYSVLGFGSMLASLLTYLYRKTPHISLLTVAYGIGFVLSVVPLLCQAAFIRDSYDPAYQIIFFSCMSGFYLPFVYDVILNACSVNYRGMVCGLIEFMFIFASLIAIVLIDMFYLGFLFVILIIPLLTLLSSILQKRAES
ncbi:MAG: hypothetical protein K9M07_04470 [Simkaniaceae bacterium]|nr:hypothetical protein [Simkaniaceae bacterium]